MLKTDYILRLIEEAIRAVARAKDMRFVGENAAAKETLDRTLEDLVGLPLEAVLALPLASLLDLLGGVERLDAAKALVVARLLFERGCVDESMGKSREARTCYRRSLALYDEVTQAAPAASELSEHEPVITDLLARLEAPTGSSQ